MVDLLYTLLLLKLKSLKAQLQYPTNFIITVLGISCIGAMDVALILVPVHAFGNIGGWGPWELCFMFSLWKMSHGLHQALFIEFWGHDELVRNGDYDVFLIRPVDPIWQILTSRFSLAAVGEWIPSVTVFVICADKVEIDWNIFMVLFLLVVLISGAVIEWSLSMFISALSFVFVKTTSLRGIAHSFLFRVAHYPAHIYGRVFQVALTFIFPYAFMAYYPTHVFFKMDVMIFHELFPYLAPVVAMVLLGIALTAYRIGLRFYNSTGT